MFVSDLIDMESFVLLNEDVDMNGEIESVYIGDLLSWVMSHAKANCAWITIQTNMNVVAVAVLVKMSCIIIAEGAKVEKDVLAKASEEQMPMLSTQLNAYEIARLLT